MRCVFRFDHFVVSSRRHFRLLPLFFFSIILFISSSNNRHWIRLNLNKWTKIENEKEMCQFCILNCTSCSAYMQFPKVLQAINVCQFELQELSFDWSTQSLIYWSIRKKTRKNKKIARLVKKWSGINSYVKAKKKHKQKSNWRRQSSIRSIKGYERGIKIELQPLETTEGGQVSIFDEFSPPFLLMCVSTRLVILLVAGGERPKTDTNL